MIQRIIVLIFISALFSQSANIYVFNNHVDIESSSEGTVQGVQMTLSHGLDFSIELVEGLMISEYATQDSHTVVILAHEQSISDHLFYYEGEIVISEIIVAMNLPGLGIEEIYTSVIYASDCDINEDVNVNVVDVVLLVNMIFDDSEFGADINQDGMVNVVDIVAMINLIFYESFLDDEHWDDIIPPDCADSDNDNICDEEEYIDLNNNGIYDEDDCMDINGDFQCDDGLGDVSGSWQLNYVAFYSGPNCEYLEGEYLGPNFEINDIDTDICTDLTDTFDHECSVGENIFLTEADCMAAGFEWEYEDCWSCFEHVDHEHEFISRLLHLNQDGSFFSFSDEDEQFSSYSYDDSDCDGTYDYCNSWTEYGTEKEFESGHYQLGGYSDNISIQGTAILTLYENAYFEIKNGTESSCNGCESEGVCSDPSINNEAACNAEGYTWTAGTESQCNEYTYDNCIDASEWSGDYDEGNTFIIEELNDNLMRLKKIEGGQYNYYNGYYNEYDDMECIYWEYSKIDSFSIGGCTLTGYANYNPYATFNDGTCNENNCSGYLNNNQDLKQFDLLK